MDDRQMGRLVLRSLPEGGSREQITGYLLRLYRQATREQVLSLLGRTPAVLSAGLPLRSARRVMADLEKLGACAVFEPHAPAPPSGAPPPAAPAPKGRSQPPPSVAPQPPQPPAKPPELKEHLLKAFPESLPRAGVPPFYQVGLFLVASTMVLLVLVYLGLIGVAGYGVLWHATANLALFHELKSMRAALFLYVTPLAVGFLLVLFMVKPLFVKQARPSRPRTLSRKGEPLVFAFVEQVCKAVGAPMPREIRVDLDVNASASLSHGIGGFLRRDLTLTFGLPLAAGLNLQQFAGVLAHEFGHFSQAAGMRLTYVIHTVNHWFSRVVYEEDEWDWRIRQWTRRLDLRIGIVLVIARCFIWLTRQMLKALMYLGHAVSCFMSRQMEYDADRRETQLVGSEVFASVFPRLAVLSLAQQGAFQSLTDSWEEGKLADDFAALVLATAKQIPDEVVKARFRSGGDARTGVFDTHPAERDRIAASRTVTPQGALAWDGSHEALRAAIERARPIDRGGVFAAAPPASVLFRDFDDFARVISLDFYRKVLGVGVRPEQLVGAAVLAESRDVEEGFFTAMNRYFQGQFSPWRPLGLGRLALVPPTDPRAALEAVKAAREGAQRSREQHAQTLKAYHKVAERRMKAGCAQALLGAGFGIDAKAFQLSSHDPASVETACRNLAQRQQEVADQLRPFEQGMHARLSGGLRLLAHPQVLSRLDGGEALKRDAERVLGAVDLLEGNLRLLGDLDLATRRLMILAGQLDGGEVQEDLHRQVLAAAAEVFSLLHGYRDSSMAAAYPLEHSRANVRVGEFLVERLPEREDLRGLLEVSSSAVERAHRLYARLAARLAHTAEAVERALGLPPLPEPPAERA